MRQLLGAMNNLLVADVEWDRLSEQQAHRLAYDCLLNGRNSVDEILRAIIGFSESTRDSILWASRSPFVAYARQRPLER